MFINIFTTETAQITIFAAQTSKSTFVGYEEFGGGQLHSHRLPPAPPALFCSVCQIFHYSSAFFSNNDICNMFSPFLSLRGGSMTINCILGHIAASQAPVFIGPRLTLFWLIVLNSWETRLPGWQWGATYQTTKNKSKIMNKCFRHWRERFFSCPC